jgi:tetraacyldisaccharide 4'-kinase
VQQSGVYEMPPEIAAMKKVIRRLLFLPVSFVYGIVMCIRNSLYDFGLLPSKEKNTAVISVGNLTVGGTGKTPHTEFIVSELQSLFRVAILSRGYKRETKGFVLANQKSNALKIGDEPMQMYLKFHGVPVAVSENRSKGIDKLLDLYPTLDAIVLDDAHQHRRIRPGLSILLTDYNRLYTRDSLLPGGNLREPKKQGARRADIIIVTKCPAGMSAIDMRVIEHEVSPSMYHHVFFSSFVYDEPLPVFIRYADRLWLFKKIKQKRASVLLVTGIVSPQMILSHLRNYTDDIRHLQFRDHHEFTEKDITLIEKQFYEIPNQEKLILMTEKDAARLINNPIVPSSLKYHLYALPIRVKILNNNETALIKKITDYVEEDSRNRLLSKKEI